LLPYFLRFSCTQEDPQTQESFLCVIFAKIHVSLMNDNDDVGCGGGGDGDDDDKAH
jgi:hypothetical protein